MEKSISGCQMPISITYVYPYDECNKIMTKQTNNKKEHFPYYPSIREYFILTSVYTCHDSSCRFIGS